MRRWFLVACAITIVVGCVTSRQADLPAHDVVLEGARAVQQARFLAMSRGDLVALDTLLADDLVYTHTTGRVETKSEFLESIRSRRIVYDSVELRDFQSRWLAPDVAVITGQAQVSVTVSDTRSEFDIRFSDVLVRRGGRWQTAVWQSTRLGAADQLGTPRPSEK